MRRREFILALGGLAARPFAARAQQGKMPVIGFLHPGFPDGAGSPAFSALRDGLRDIGYVDGDVLWPGAV